MTNKDKKISVTQHQLDLLIFCVNEEYHRMIDHFYGQPNKYKKMSYEILELKKYLYSYKDMEKEL